MLFILCMSGSILAQGVTRPHGLGMRAGFWNMSDNTTRFNLSTSPGSASGSISISGVGFWFYFYSRVRQNLFMQMELGVVGTAQASGEDLFKTDTNVDAMVPMLAGLRYDLLSGSSSSRLQPYVSFAVGPYWSSEIKVEHDMVEENVIGESKQYFGGYLGGGVNLMVSSWLGFNFDVRHHFVDWRVNNRYSGMEYGLGLYFMWGRNREMFQIKDIKLIVKDLYPAYCPFYNTYPLALVTLSNTAGYAIEVNVRGVIEGYSARPKESGFIRLESGETRDIPVHAMLNAERLNVHQRKTVALDLVIEARAGSTMRKQVSASLMIHHRNAWDGDAEKLPLYVTADNPAILQLARAMAPRFNAGNLEIAKAVFDSLSRKNIVYRRDPNVPFYQDDRVQFAEETLEQAGGDCDDLVVLYASLLQSLGINTVFVEVRNPQNKIAHLYLLFDSGIGVEERATITSNDKRLVMREESNDKTGVWIPVETTLIGKSFEEAWTSAATQWYEDTVLSNGVAEGWVKIVDVVGIRFPATIPVQKTAGRKN